MGAETATPLAAPRGLSCDEKSDRTDSLRNIADALRLYEELERALAQLDDEAITRVAIASRGSRRALSLWARQIALFRDLDRTRGTDAPRHSRPHRLTLRPSWLWEAVAFAIGCAVSFLLI
jgi:hypothetical protein